MSGLTYYAELVDRLRAWATCESTLHDEAADAIERLSAELADCKWYREALATEAKDLSDQVDALEAELACAKPLLEAATEYVNGDDFRGNSLMEAAEAYARAKARETKDGG